MTIDYGQTLAFVRTATGLDLDTTMRIETNPYTALENAIICRLSTPRGAIPEHPEYGYDLRQLLGATLTTAQLTQAQGLAAKQLEQDERIAKARVKFTLNRSAGILSATVAAVLETGDTFTRVLSVSAVTVELLNIQLTD